MFGTETTTKDSSDEVDCLDIPIARAIPVAPENNGSKFVGYEPYSPTSFVTAPSIELSNEVLPMAPMKQPTEESHQEYILDWVRSYEAKNYGPRENQKAAYHWFNSQDGGRWKAKFPLHYAAMHGDVDEIKRLCASGHDPNKKMGAIQNNSKITFQSWFDSEPLGWAASFGELKAVIALIECGADPLRTANKAGNTPLKHAIREGHQSTTLFLRSYETQVKGNKIITKMKQMSNREKLDYIFNLEEFKNGGSEFSRLCCDTCFFFPCFVICPNQCLAMWGCSGLLDCMTSSPCKYIPCSICNPNTENPLYSCYRPIQFAANYGQLHTVMVLAKNGADNFCDVSTFREYCRSDAMYHKQFHVVDWLDAWASIGCPTPIRMERFEYINNDYEYPHPHNSNESTSDAKYQTPHLNSSAFHENRSDGREFVLRLKDGRGLTTKDRHLFDHPNGSGRQCLNIMIGVSTGDSATRVHLDGPVNRCALLLEGRTAGLHVSHGSPGPNVANSQVIFHAAAPAGDTKFRPADDKWQWNQQQGTLSPCANTALVMGLVSDDDNKYVGLVHRGSPTEFKFAIEILEIENGVVDFSER